MPAPVALRQLDNSGTCGGGEHVFEQKRLQDKLIGWANSMTASNSTTFSSHLPPQASESSSATSSSSSSSCDAIITFNESLGYTCDENYTSQDISNTIKLVFYDMVNQVDPVKRGEWLSAQIKLYETFTDNKKVLSIGATTGEPGRKKEKFNSFHFTSK